MHSSSDFNAEGYAYIKAVLTSLATRASLDSSISESVLSYDDMIRSTVVSKTLGFDSTGAAYLVGGRLVHLRPLADLTVRILGDVSHEVMNRLGLSFQCFNPLCIMWRITSARRWSWCCRRYTFSRRTIWDVSHPFKEGDQRPALLDQG